MKITAERIRGRHKKEGLTFEVLDMWREFLGYKWKGPWQERAARHICKHRYVTFQGPRQKTGKSFICGKLIGSFFLFIGEPVVVSFPTIKIGSRVLVEGIEEAISKAEDQDHSLKREVNNVNYKRWSNGGRMYLVSSDEQSQVEGLTATILFIDEAQTATMLKFATMTPYLDVAEDDEKARCILLGISAHRNSALGQMKINEEYAPLVITTDEILEADPKYERTLRRRLAELGDFEFARNYKIIDIAEGERKLLGHIPACAEYCDALPPYRFFAIDVGRHTDETILGVFEERPAAFVGDVGEQYRVINLIERVRIPRTSFADQWINPADGEPVPEPERHKYNNLELVKGQGHILYDEILARSPGGRINPDAVRMERNAIGEGLYDEIAANWIPNIGFVYMTNEWKVGPENRKTGVRDIMIGRLRLLTRSGLLGCYEESVRAELNSLCYTVKEVDDKTEIVLEHNDTLQMILVALTGVEPMDLMPGG